MAPMKAMKSAPKAVAKPKAKAKAEAEPGFSVFMKHENGENIKVSIYNNPTVKQFMVSALRASTDMDEFEIADDGLSKLYVVTAGGRVLNKRSRLMSLIESGTRIDVRRK